MGIYCFRMDSPGHTLGFSAQVAQLVDAAIANASTSRHEIAVKAGIPRETFRRRLAGQTPFTVDELERVAKALDTEPTAFMPTAEAVA